MDNKALSDVATGIFRLRMDDPHMTDSTIVDVHDDEYTTLTTVEVRSGAVVLHCSASWEEKETVHEYVLKDDEEEEEEDEESEDDEDSDDEDEESDEEEEEEEEEEGTKTYTIASGNSVTVRATTVRLEPIGLETAEGVYRVQMMRAD